MSLKTLKSFILYTLWQELKDAEYCADSGDAFYEGQVVAYERAMEVVEKKFEEIEREAKND